MIENQIQSEDMNMAEHDEEKELAEQIKTKVRELSLLTSRAYDLDMEVTLENQKSLDSHYYAELDGVEILSVHISKTSTVRY